MVRLIIGLIIWAGFIFYEIRRHHTIIELLKERPNYLHSFGVRAFFGLVAMVLIIPSDIDPLLSLYDLITDIPYYWKVNPFLVAPLILANPAAVAVVFLTTSFYLVFDPLLAKKRKKPNWIIYRGKNSGWLDRLPLPVWLGLKVISIALLIISSARIWQQ